jgi:hypothetical protein
MQGRSITDATSTNARRSRRRRAAAVLASAALALSALGTPALADGSPDLSQPHRHALLLHVEMEPFSYGGCVDLAGARALRTNIHHETVHTGQAGTALQRAGHLVVPYTCAQLEAALGG